MSTPVSITRQLPAPLSGAASIAQHYNDLSGRSHDSGRQFHRYSTRDRCPHCDHDAPCIYFESGDTLCHREGSPSDWTDAFIGGYWHRAHADAVASIGVQRLARVPRTPRATLASADVLHAVYSDLAGRCPLTDAHRALLGGPGHNLTAEQTALYASLPESPAARAALAAALAAAHGEAIVLGVPGIHRYSGRLIVGWGGGILLPRRDQGGRLTGFQVRSDQPDPTARYTWLSGGTDGPSCGAAAHIAQPRELRDPHRVIIVEGIKKADLLAAHFGCTVIGIAGCGTWVHALPALDALADRGVDVCVVALDQDIKPTAVGAVDRARQSIAAAAAARGYAVRLASWDPAFAKGPDDLITAGGTFTLARHRPESAPAGAALGVTGDGDTVQVPTPLFLHLAREASATNVLRRKYQAMTAIATDPRLKDGQKTIVLAAAMKTGFPSNGEATTPVRVFRDDIARATGQSLGTISRALPDLEAMGVLEIDRRSVARERTVEGEDGRTRTLTRPEGELWVSLRPLPDRSIGRDELQALAGRRNAAAAKARRCPGCGSTTLTATAWRCGSCDETCLDHEALEAGTSIVETPSGLVDSTTGELLTPGRSRRGTSAPHTPDVRTSHTGPHIDDEPAGEPDDEPDVRIAHTIGTYPTCEVRTPGLVIFPGHGQGGVRSSHAGLHSNTWHSPVGAPDDDEPWSPEQGLYSAAPEVDDDLDD